MVKGRIDPLKLLIAKCNDCALTAGLHHLFWPSMQRIRQLYRFERDRIKRANGSEAACLGGWTEIVGARHIWR